MGAPEHQHGPPLRQSEPDLVQGFTRLEQQVAFNYNMIQGHHQDVARISEAVARLQHEMRTVIGFMDEMRNDLRSGRFPPRAADPGRYDPADVEVLANQIANVTTKANEVDNLKIQIELMKQRLNRFESQSATNAPGAQPEGAAARADQKHHDAMRAQQVPGQPLPSMRPGVSLSSEHGRQPSHQSTAPVLESQPGAGFHSAQERQPIAAEQAQQAARQPGFRPVEPLPPSNSMSSWRPAGPAGAAESYPSGGPTPPTHSHPLRSHPPESEPQATGWAAVNLNQGPKRSIDEHHPAHDSSQPGSPKRPKLAPLKPRSSFGDEHHHSPYAQAAHMDAAHQTRGRIPSGDVPIQPHSQFNPAPVPGQGATNSYRFITSTVTGQPDGQEQWRAADGGSGMDARFEHSLGGTGRGRGRGNRGGRRGGRGRGGRSSSGAADVPPPAPEAPAQEHVHTMQVPPEWREHQWAAQQAATNGHFPGQHTFSPIEAARSAAADLAVHTPAPPHGLPYPAGHEHEFPATPIASNADPYAMANDLDSANKKTRTKPIRNSDGVLIRKDGRPDMRSVSSANNLRKVHAKKEAEKAEMEGRTPTSGRSLQPNNSSSLSDDEGMEEGDYMDEGDLERERMVDSEGRTVTPGTQQDAEHTETVNRHRELMNRMFNEGPKGTAEAWFPRVEAPPLDVKREDHENREREARWRGMEDAAMRDGERPEVERREISQRPSEPLSREQTSIEVAPKSTVASETAVSEQPESEAGAAAAAAAKAPEARSLSAAVEGEKDAAKKDSTQLDSSAERVASEPVAGVPSAPAV